MYIKINQQFDDTKIILQSINSYLALEYAIWIKDKAKIKFTKEMPPFSIINNFIYWCNLGINIGSEQNKIRPVLIAKTKKESSICTVLPLTSERINDTRWYHIDLEKSWMIGDRETDIKAGRAAGCKTILVGDMQSSEKANYQYKNLSAAVNYILEQQK